MEIMTESYNERVNMMPLWLDFLAITVAELLTVFFQLLAGIITHGILLVVFIIQSIITRDIRQRNLFMALCLAPLIRILSLAMPLAPLPQIYWYILIYGPLAAAAVAVMVTTGMKPVDAGLVTRGIILQIVIGAVIGIVLGVVEYLILKPAPLAASFTFKDIWLPALILIFTTGLVEELIFRGVLQFLSEKVMGLWSVLYVSLIFAVLHVGHYSLLDVVFVFAVALIFTAIMKKTGSLIGIILSHGIANALLYTVMPFILS